MYKAPRGTSDILPKDQAYWTAVGRATARVAQLYGYQRIDTPTFEESGLFVRTIGEETDIVEKEVYSLEDRSGDKLTLRPEGTAPVCRAYVEHGMHTLPQPVRLWYFADIFRYERPQAGRYRQHHQFGVEAIGDPDAALDAEVIEMAWQLYADLGLTGLALNLNSIGCDKCRPRYLESLQAYYTQHKESMCSDCKRRLSKNPLRLLDCKKPTCVPLTEQAPKSQDYLCEECAAHFAQLRRYLEALGLPYVLNHRLVRGLDYYTKTVFEIAPEGEVLAQATVGGGGRYDKLIEQLGGPPTPAVGFATGLERLIINMKNQNIEAPASQTSAVYVAHVGREGKDHALKLASRLRRAGVNSVLSLGDRKLKAQLRHANALGARHAVIIGEEEISSGAVVVRDMARGEQDSVPVDNVIDVLRIH